MIKRDKTTTFQAETYAKELRHKKEIVILQVIGKVSGLEIGFF